MRLLTLSFLAILLSSCATSPSFDHTGRFDFSIDTNKKIILAVHDLRPYVQDSNKSPDYTGLERNKYGIPSGVGSKSGNPLAEDFGSMIVRTMKFRNVSAVQQKIPFSWSFSTVKKNLLGQQKGAYVYYVKMLEWYTDTYARTTLHYDLQLIVFDDQSNEVGNKQEKGFFDFDENEPGKENLTKATSAILESLFAEQ